MILRWVKVSIIDSKDREQKIQSKPGGIRCQLMDGYGYGLYISWVRFMIMCIIRVRFKFMFVIRVRFMIRSMIMCMIRVLGNAYRASAIYNSKRN